MGKVKDLAIEEGNRRHEEAERRPDTESDAPRGLRFLGGYELQERLGRISWSPDGGHLAAGGETDTHILKLYSNPQRLHVVRRLGSPTFAPAWSPRSTESRLVFANGGVPSIFDANWRQISQVPMAEGHPSGRIEGGSLHLFSWSPSGRWLAWARSDVEVGMFLVDMERRGQPLSIPLTHSPYLLSWTPDSLALLGNDGHMFSLKTKRSEHAKDALIGIYCRTWRVSDQLFAAGDGSQIRILSPSGDLLRVLEGHSWTLEELSFSADGRLLASRSYDHTVRLWSTETWECVAVLQSKVSRHWPGGLAFHPRLPLLVTVGEEDTVLRLWEVDVDALLGSGAAQPSEDTRYRNAKVVLLGDSGVGKSGLALVLTGQPFAPTESTHGRRVYPLHQGVCRDQGLPETREVLLWDLAGQPGYRLVHQLHLDDVAVALVVYDARSETDPLAGVRHWARALRLAARRRGSAPPEVFLVAGRDDRGGAGVSRERIEALCQELGFRGHFETSAREDRQIDALREAMLGSIAWGALPGVSSNRQLMQIRAFLLQEKEGGHVLIAEDDLYLRYLRFSGAAGSPELRESFRGGVRRLDTTGLIRRLDFGDLVLLQPELLDAYASAMVNVARDEPDGLGAIREEDARAGRFRMPEDERARAHEALLLLATVEEILNHEIALREPTEGGEILVFPSQLTREFADAPDIPGRAAVVGFQGPVLSVYATLVVRASRSEIFTREDMWKNVARFSAAGGGTCGLALRELGEGVGELTLFYASETASPTRAIFESFVLRHLARRALPETVRIRRLLCCAGCGDTLPEAQVARRRAAGKQTITCGGCETSNPLPSTDPTPQPLPELVEMDRSADEARDRETRATTLDGKRATEDYDIFLSYNSRDRAEVETIYQRLLTFGILPWMDSHDLRAGDRWQPVLERHIERQRAVAVLIGSSGQGPWQELEVEAFISQAVLRGCRIIPVFLGSLEAKPKLPPFLGLIHAVDFSSKDHDPMEKLVEGILGPAWQRR